MSKDKVEKFLEAYKKLCLKYDMMLFDTPDPSYSKLRVGSRNPKAISGPEVFIDEQITAIVNNREDG